MEFTAVEIIRNASHTLSYKIAGISHLFQNFQSAGQGKDDDENMVGIGMFLEGLSKECKKIASLADDAACFDPKIKINTDDFEGDEVSGAILFFENLRREQKADV